MGFVHVGVDTVGDGLGDVLRSLSRRVSMANSRVGGGGAVEFHFAHGALGDGDVAAAFVFDDEHGGVRRDDAPAASEIGDFILELLALAVEADFVEQVADAARGPEFGDPFPGVVGLVFEDDILGEFLQRASLTIPVMVTAVLPAFS